MSTSTKAFDTLKVDGIDHYVAHNFDAAVTGSSWVAVCGYLSPAMTMTPIEIQGQAAAAKRMINERRVVRCAVCREIEAKELATGHFDASHSGVIEPDCPVCVRHAADLGVDLRRS